VDLPANLTTIVLVVLFSTIGVPLLVYMLLGATGRRGTFPEDVKTQLGREGLLYLVEAVPISVRLRRFRAPGRHSSYSFRRGWGSLAVTKERVVGYVGRKDCIIDVPIDHPKFAALQIAAKGDQKLCVSFEASDFNDQQSDSVELRYRVASVPKVLSIFRSLT
jgi:hypothetical protein